MFNNVYDGKKVLVTGHSGFKGAWLSAWLIKLGAQVVGISDCVPTNPSLFDAAGLKKYIDHRSGDIRDLSFLTSLINEARPDFLFHLAAQAIVSTSYERPIDTITTNVIGTANVLEALRKLNHFCAAVIITSDKCYENVEWAWGYKETDQLGGKDIYSGSKGAAEIVFRSYFHSFFNEQSCRVRPATARAGNVIGGGDWAKDRIVADCMRRWSNGLPVDIRNPHATRPWQHVLEPLSGYLTLGESLSRSEQYSGESYNFGPPSNQNRTVIDLITDLSRCWHSNKQDQAYRINADKNFSEAELLKLNCDKALFDLKWESSLDYIECVNLVSDWYFQFYHSVDALELTLSQIEQYELKAIERKRVWTL